MEFRKGMVVRSRAGHDKGSLFVILSIEAGKVLVANGGERSLTRPKGKNPKHLSALSDEIELSGLTDKKLRTVLRGIASGGENAEESE